MSEGPGLDEDRDEISDRRAPRLLIRPSVITILFGLVGLAGGSYLLRENVVVRPIDTSDPAGLALALVGLALVAYGVSQVRWVGMSRGELHQRGLVNRRSFDVSEVRSVYLGMRRRVGLKFWLPLVDTLDGRSAPLDAIMSLGRKKTEKRIERIRTAFDESPQSSVADPFAGSSFNMTPSYIATTEEPDEPQAFSLTPGFDEYLRAKAAGETAPITAPVAAPVMAAPPPVAPAQSPIQQPVSEPAPAVFEPQPLVAASARSASPAEPEPAPAITSFFGSPTTPEPTQPAPITSLFSSQAAAEPAQPTQPTQPVEPVPHPPTITSLFGSQP